MGVSEGLSGVELSLRVGEEERSKEQADGGGQGTRAKKSEVS